MVSYFCLYDENLYLPQMVERTKTKKDSNLKNTCKKHNCYFEHSLKLTKCKPKIVVQW